MHDYRLSGVDHGMRFAHIIGLDAVCAPPRLEQRKQLHLPTFG